MPKTTMRVEGLRDLQKALLELESRATQNNVKKRALLAAAEPIAARARALAPVGEGRLRDAIEVETRQPRPKRDKDYYGVAVWVRETSDYRQLATPVAYQKLRGGRRQREYAYGSIPYVYGAFVEFGTSRQPATPFMRPAYDSEGGARAVNRIADSLRIEIDKAAARAARKAMSGKG